MLWKSSLEAMDVDAGWLRCFDKHSSRELAKYTTELRNQSKELAQSLLVYGFLNAPSHRVLASYATEFTA